MVEAENGKLLEADWFDLYNAAIYLIPITLEILKISLLFPCHIPITIELASATAGLFCGTICPLT